MSEMDYENAQVQPRGSVLPWLLLTGVVAMAAVGMFAFNMQKEQAMGAMDKYKQETEALKGRQTALSQQVEEAQRQIASMKLERDDMERKMNEATTKADELGQQLELTKKEAAAAPSASKHKSRSRRRR